MVENVIGYYKPLIKPQEVGGHYFWSNFLIPQIKTKNREHDGLLVELEKRKGFNLEGINIGIEKRLLLRNCVEPDVGLHVFECAFKGKQTNLSWAEKEAKKK